jgi:ATP-dependent DNA helicase PIF1
MDLSKEQSNALNLIKSGKNILIQGSAGSGKSHLIRYIVISKILNKKIHITAMTGTAAVLLGCDATTFHSWVFKDLGNKSVEEYVKIINSKYIWLQSWRTTSILVVDEVSMMTAELLDKFDKIARIVRKDPGKPFGGIQLILTGDFFQLPPIIEDAHTADVPVELSKRLCFEWDEFPYYFKVIEFNQNFRQQSDLKYQQILNRIRLGECLNSDVMELEKRMIEVPEGLIKPTKLHTLRKDVQYINDMKLDKLEGKSMSWSQEWNLEYDSESLVQKELNKPMIERFRKSHADEIQNRLDKFDKNNQHESELILKIGAQVMLIFNLDVKNGLANGSRGVVVDTTEDMPIVLFTNGLKIPITYVSWNVHIWDNKAKLTRSQIPLKLAYAISIHKSQGLTLDYAEIDIGSSVFEFGQAYVALSRVKNLEGLFLRAFDKTKIKVHPRVLEWYSKLVVLRNKEEYKS